MRWISRLRSTLFCAMLLALSARAWADADLGEAYAAILRGEYPAARAAIDAAKRSPGGADAARADSWLSSYENVLNAREAVRTKTFDWHCEQARKALADEKTYLALSFTSLAADYASDLGEFAKSELVRDVTDRALAEATKIEKEAKWRDALRYYVQLERIHEGDAKHKERRVHAGRHARLEFLYTDKKAVERRIDGVSSRLLKEAIDRINDTYYRSPDFKALADSALGNLEALTETPKLFEVFDGLANPDLRNFFLKNIQERRADIKNKAKFDAKDFERLFRDVLAVNKESVELRDELLVVEFLEGATENLDEFTSMIWPADQTDFDKSMMGEFQGVGIQLGTDEFTSRLKVVTPLEDSPALEAGIEPGDLIIDVDGKSTKGWTTEDAIRNITGPAGTPVTLTIFRPSTGEKMNYPLKRRQINLRSVSGVQRLDDPKGLGWDYMLDKDVGVAYIRLSGFNAHSQQELDTALQEAKTQGMKGLILDLRNNPGGLLETAVSTVSTFQRGGRVVSTEGRREQKEVHDVTGSAAFPDLPLAVLVNEGSASASEILSGALKDQNRAVVIGTRTFGKGSVQRVIPLSRTARIKLTTAIYYLPSGRSPHKSAGAEIWGVDPNYTVKMMRKEFERMFERQRDANIIRKGLVAAKVPTIDEETRKKNLESLKDGEAKADDEDEERSPALLTEEDITALQADPHKAPDADPQIEAALLELRVKLAANLPWPRNVAASESTPTHDRD